MLCKLSSVTPARRMRVSSESKYGSERISPPCALIPSISFCSMRICPLMPNSFSRFSSRISTSKTSEPTSCRNRSFMDGDCLSVGSGKRKPSMSRKFLFTRSPFLYRSIRSRSVPKREAEVTTVALRSLCTFLMVMPSASIKSRRVLLENFSPSGRRTSNTRMSSSRSEPALCTFV